MSRTACIVLFLIAVSTGAATAASIGISVDGRIDRDRFHSEPGDKNQGQPDQPDAEPVGNDRHEVNREGVNDAPRDREPDDRDRKDRDQSNDRDTENADRPSGGGAGAALRGRNSAKRDRPGRSESKRSTRNKRHTVTCRTPQTICRFSRSKPAPAGQPCRCRRVSNAVGLTQ
jgi:hypothetical protein